MSEEENNIQTQEKVKLETGTYEIIRRRLDTATKELQTRLAQLNAERKKVFGATEAALLTSETIITDVACKPADMFPIGNHFILGYNLPRKIENVQLTDVFSAYTYSDREFHKIEPKIIDNQNFKDDFKNLYTYYKNTQFLKFSKIGVHLFMLFKTGNNTSDKKVFKWEISGNSLEYIDNRSEADFHYPKQHEFKWKKTTRDMHVAGREPHINIENTLFVETVGGDLTIKAENNTEDALGVYREDVDIPDQTLDDAQIYYSILGNIIILKIRPYQEKNYRYIVYSPKTKEAVRIDTIKNACVQLPENHGIIFSNGYYLQTGEYQFFDSEYENLIFESKLISPNGEDFLYNFYEEKSGVYILLKYNIIEQKLEPPITCNGFSIFENGEMCNFRDDGQAKKSHVIQVWKTTFSHPDYNTGADSQSPLFKIGNKALVKGISEVREVLVLLGKSDSYDNLYIELVKKSASIIDRIFWISKPEALHLGEALRTVKNTAASAIDEYEKISKIKEATAKKTNLTTAYADELYRKIRRGGIENLDDFVHLLAELRKLRGELISLKQLRYINTEQVENYETEAEKFSAELSENCVTFLLKEDALTSYSHKVNNVEAEVEALKKVSEANKIDLEISNISGELEMLIEIVSNLQISDATQTAKIIDNISTVYSRFNKIKAELRRRRSELFLIEGKAEFGAQIKLISQSVINYLDLCDTPEKTDAYLTKLLILLEELEGKFSEFDEFVNEVGIKREEIQDAFEQRKIQLTEKRSRRADTLVQSAGRILKAVSSRISKLKSLSEINGYFASDLMAEKMRSIIKELTELDENVKADELQSRLKTAKEDAARRLKDKNDLFGDDENVIKFGQHRFTVNTQPLGLTMINRSGEMYFHLSGTGFYEKVNHPEFEKLSTFRDQTIVSENDKVYRAEYLAYSILTHIIEDEKLSPKSTLEMSQKDFDDFISTFASVRYAEGYIKGVHDFDAGVLLKAILEIRQKAGLLRFSSSARAMAELWFYEFIEKQQQAAFLAHIKSASALLKAFPNSKEHEFLLSEIKTELDKFSGESQLFDTVISAQAAQYLFYELAENETFVLNKMAKKLLNLFSDYLKSESLNPIFDQVLKDKAQPKVQRFRQIKSWLVAFAESNNSTDFLDYTNEATVTLFRNSLAGKKQIDVSLKQIIVGLEGTHKLITDQKYQLNYNEFMRKLTNFEKNTVPNFRKYQALKKEITEDFEKAMRLKEFVPRVMSSFVRNRLINNVYLPLIGANLAKQIGAAGSQKRTDLMGMLLLISPPGYGKTTLMEYLAERLGIIFMKINGPAIGHNVTGVDPSQAGDATAKEELEKLNLAFEIGDNVMIYLDDIQHCNPEFLQKFISLADGQRKIEGIYKGQAKTYDFRGKKVCIIMAGNPYTESGDKFQIPDMLANRADIYNLGDILGGAEDDFLMSYIENSMSSNSVLSNLASKSQKDIYSLVKNIETNSLEGIEYEGNHSPEELNDYREILKKVIHLRGIIYKVNRNYILSAGQAEDYRTEPPFKLQGSYRDMNKMVEKIMPVMNTQELQILIVSHYESESQTLTSGAEANFLKFKQITGIISPEEEQRFEEIVAIYMENKQQDSSVHFAQIAENTEIIASSMAGVKEAIVQMEVR